MVPASFIVDQCPPVEMSAHRRSVAAINPLLAEAAQLIEAILAERERLPEPSMYATHKIWYVWQKKDNAIRNLRPPTKQGLPIEVLHPAFASFLANIRSMDHDEWAREDDANQASLEICRDMAFGFENGVARRTKLVESLRHVGLGVEVDCSIPPNHKLETHSARPDLRIAAGRRTILLGDVKHEFETGDAYMQVSRSYQALVHNLQSQKLASDGVPCILLAVWGQ